MLSTLTLLCLQEMHPERDFPLEVRVRGTDVSRGVINP